MDVAKKPALMNLNLLEELPLELCEQIMKKLNPISQIRLGAVSHSLRQITKRYEKEEKPPLFPWLMLSPADPQSSTREFFSFQDGGVTLTLKLYVPAAARGRPFRGSSQGWLLMKDWCARPLLINPLSQIPIHLPSSLKTLPSCDANFRKMVLSSSPTNHDCVVAALNFPGWIYFCKPGDHQWISLTLFSHDLVFYKGRFHGTDKIKRQLMVYEFDDSRRSVEATRCHVLPPEAEIANKVYLVESRGELLLVLRRCSYGLNQAKTTGFQVFMLDWIGSKWVRMDSLGDRILFLGSNSSLSISARDFSSMNLKGNCIYFTDDYCYLYLNHEDSPKYIDIGVFYLDDGRIEPCYPTEAHRPRAQFPPMWFMPDLYH